MRTAEPMQDAPRPRSAAPWQFPVLLATYFSIVIAVFFAWMQPSLTGVNNHHIAADSGTYIYFADALRERRIDAFVASSLFSFPNTLWGATLLAYMFPQTFNELLFNLALFSLALWLFRRSIDLDMNHFLLLLVMNPTTSISLMATNKEILDLLVLALFVYYLRHGHHLLLVLAVLISLVSRYETALTMVILLFLRSKWNPLRTNRRSSLLSYCVALNVVIALVLRSPTQTMRLTEAETTASAGGLLLFLNSLEQHFLFIVAVVPKIFQNAFGKAVNVSHWSSYSADEPANSSLLLGNNLANMAIMVVLLLQRRLNLRSSLVYYATILAVTMSVALIVQPRYYYGAYVLLCLEAARRIPATVSQVTTREVHAAA